MLTNIALVKHFSLPLLLLLLALCGVDGATVTWGQVNKYASTLYAQDVYLTAATADVKYDDAQHSGYTITAVHVYDMTHNGDAGSAQLLSGGIGQRHATIRFQRHSALGAQMPSAHFQLVIYGVDL